MGHLENAGSTQPLEFWLQDLERRRALMKPEHTMRGFFFNGLMENIRTLGDEALARRCLEACGEERFVDFFNYSVQLLPPILRTSLPLLAERHGGGENALRQVGRRASSDFMASVAGKAMLMLAQNRPRPLINSIPSAFRVGMSFSHAELTWMGPTRGRLQMDISYMPPPFHEGMVRYMLEATSAQGIQVTARATGELLITCDFSWE
ncbi:TIGR02265 family protein [Melittangium boletus]|nr:TIGR02265 family protein [Melittangium boletus]